jgi:hypothetical protein
MPPAAARLPWSAFMAVAGVHPAASVRRVLLACALAVSASVSVAATTKPAVEVGTADLDAPATWVLPGLITRDMSIDDLGRVFGKANVAPGTLDGAEGATIEGIVLFGADPLRRAEIFVSDDKKLRGIETIRVSGPESRWHVDNGVRPGMTLDELVALNGKPVRFSGLDWDYGGGILDWNGGKLAPRDDDSVFRGVTLAYEDESEAAYPTGDSEFSSDDPAYPLQGKQLHVGKVTVNFVSATPTP